MIPYISWQKFAFWIIVEHFQMFCNTKLGSRRRPHFRKKCKWSHNRYQWIHRVNGASSLWHWWALALTGHCLMQWFSTRDNTSCDVYGTKDHYQNDDCTILFCTWYFRNFRNLVFKVIKYGFSLFKDNRFPSGLGWCEISLCNQYWLITSVSY